MLYHVALPDDWKLAQKDGVYTPQIFDEHHLIPCCDSDQLPKYINTNFRKKREVVVLVITEKIIAEQIQHHSLSNGHIFPHIIGALPLSAIRLAVTIRPNFNGIYILPPELQGY